MQLDFTDSFNFQSLKVLSHNILLPEGFKLRFFSFWDTGINIKDQFSALFVIGNNSYTE